jgi:hypothetical protein
MRFSKSFLVAATSLTLSISIPASAVDNAKKQKLNPDSGDAIAHLLDKGIAENELLCAPAKVNYDKQNNKIRIIILGSRDRVEPDMYFPEENPGAHDSLNDYWLWVKKQFCRIEKKHGVKLVEKDITIVYLYSPSPLIANELIRVEDGRFRLPDKQRGSSFAQKNQKKKASRDQYASLP